MNTAKVILVVVLSAIAGALVYKSSVQPQMLVKKAPVVEVVTTEYPRPAPYWTQYGLPEYWPATLSPYWYYGAPLYGPIGSWGGYGSGGYGRPGRGHPSHMGYSGVASGGGGGGGGGHGGR